MIASWYFHDHLVIAHMDTLGGMAMALMLQTLSRYPWIVTLNLTLILRFIYNYLFTAVTRVLRISWPW